MEKDFIAMDMSETCLAIEIADLARNGDCNVFTKVRWANVLDGTDPRTSFL